MSFFKHSKYSQVCLILTLIIIVIFFAGFYLGLKYQSFSIFKNNILSDAQERLEIINTGPGNIVYVMPGFNFPTNYFSEENILWGNAGEGGDYEDKTTWETAVISDGYQSFPTTIISLASSTFSNVVSELPPQKTKPEILFNAGIFEETFIEQMSKFEQFALRLLPEDIIVNTKKFDVDGDGVEESIVETCTLGGNHCPHKIIIIKGTKMIFSLLSGGGPGINLVDSKTSNGFIVEWTPWKNAGSKWDTGLCCTIGHIKTRFIYKGGVFVPIYEQEVLYFKVNSTKD